MAARCAYPGYGSLYQTVTQHRRPAQAQRRRASCQTPFRHCAGWRRAAPYPGYGSLYQTVIQHRRPAQAQRRRASCTRLRSVVVPDGGYALSGLPSPQL
ncbi:hypothetical protein J4734_09100 [Klebsiella pneumoniae]|uniref:Uncharacterized protein n=1 Tax=Klebsiella pneumoniae TaxID=573 RepID=A0A939NMV3_KLEPN|nr:hypothetical protein [Klebsiella pneumoniae]